MDNSKENYSYAQDRAGRVARIEDALRRYMPQEAGLADPVREAMEYALMAGGKRIRPQLLLLTYEAFRTKKAYTDENDKNVAWGSKVISTEIPEIFASALEMIHTYSLVHDDLPAMDDDSLRRGRPTVHVVYGEDVAILAGDGLLNFAYELAASAMERVPGDRRVEQAMMILARRPGLFGMLGGQTADVTLAGKKLEDDQLTFIYANKTAALLECAMQIGAVLGGATPEETEQIRKSAYAAGIAFQVQDDILDMISDAETLGKEVGQDERNEKTTYVTLHGMEAAQAYVQQLTDEANALLRGLFLEENAAAAELIDLLQGLAARKF